ncbi:MAG: prephenate dehydrogenase [Halieaceae bacterium]|nr:prephenate dehydrogenase [Halieaceae bacterium]
MRPIQDMTVAFLGLGLISGSLAGALRAAEWCGPIIAWGPRERSLERGHALGLIDRFSLDLESVMVDADIVVIGAPPIATLELLPEVLEMARAHDDPIVTDMASIKASVVEAAMPYYAKFVPGHPIAGSEHSGVEAAIPDLFQGREVILTPLPETDATALSAVQAMWELAGARVTQLSVSDHDAALAASSHVPHMLAYALTAVLSDHPLRPMKHGGGALRDMTRIAASDPGMWRDIALTNQDAILTAMDAVAAQHAQLRALVAEADGPAMEALFAHCREVRRKHDVILNPLLRPDEGES